MSELTDEQKKLIAENYKSIPDLTRLTQIVSGDDTIDGRSKIGRSEGPKNAQNLKRK